MESLSTAGTGVDVQKSIFRARHDFEDMRVPTDKEIGWVGLQKRTYTFGVPTRVAADMDHHYFHTGAGKALDFRIATAKLWPIDVAPDSAKRVCFLKALGHLEVADVSRVPNLVAFLKKR